MPQDADEMANENEPFKQPDSIGSSNSALSANTVINNNNRPAIEKKQSNRSIRSPLPLNHSIARQHSTSSNANLHHHRQYVLLRDKNPNANVSNSPLMTAESPQLHPQVSESSTTTTNPLIPGKPKPYLRKQPSAKYIFSVDDDEDEIEEDLNREYLEGYNDALRQRFKPLANQHSNPGPLNTSNAISSDQIFSNRSISAAEKKREIESDTILNLQQASKNLKELKELESDSSHHNHNLPQLQGYSGDSNYDESQDTMIVPDQQPLDEEIDDNASIHSNESFTLKERQVAINETHPFGIRIWKPAIYKKDRSVQKEAELDVHAIPGAKRSIGYSVRFFNTIWTLTCGLLIFILCYILGTITYLFSMFFNPQKNDSIKYAKFYYNLAHYMLYPFGKIVILKTDKNYIQEDANVGSTMDEFTKWRTENQGKLFFSSTYNNSNNNVTTTPDDTIPSPMVGTSLDDRNHEPSQTFHPNNRNHHPDNEDEEHNVTFYKKRFFGRGDWNLGRVIFYLTYYTVLAPVGFIISSVAWMSIFCIPMSKVLTIMASHIRRHPLALSFENEEYYESQYATNPAGRQNESFLILTYRSFGLHYYKYTVDGTNIFFINLNFLVIFTILDFYLFKESFKWDSFFVNSTFIFMLCLISIIPLAYFIGQAVASISAQTSMGLGAVINAFFSTIVEVYLYCIALDQSKAKLVEGSLIGSILGGVLLLPGGSMCFGAIRRKTQRYNPASAGVSSTMLLYAIIVMLSPTILYQIYGEYKVKCTACDISIGEDCRNCHYYQTSVVIDPLYINYLRPFTVICALSLFLVYCICLLFTLKTHAALIWSSPVSTSTNTKERKLEFTPNISAQANTEEHSINSFSLNDQQPTAANAASTRPSKLNLKGNIDNKQAALQQAHKQQLQQQLLNQQHQHQPQQNAEPEAGGHDAPNWSRTKSTTILLGATLLYAIIAEILVDCVDDVLKSIAIDPKFLGLTIFALVPNTTEFVNAFSFAMHGNVALSMEIGSAYALQVCLLQIPIVVLYSVWNFSHYTDDVNGVQMLLNNQWWKLPRLSEFLGLSKTIKTDDLSIVMTNRLVNNPYEIFNGLKVREVLNIGVDKIFPLIFPHWDFVASLFGVYLFTYIYTEGKSNYFKGSILIFLYLVLMSGFYIALKVDASNAYVSDGFEIFGNQTWIK